MFLFSLLNEIKQAWQGSAIAQMSLSVFIGIGISAVLLTLLTERKKYVALSRGQQQLPEKNTKRISFSFSVKSAFTTLYALLIVLVLLHFFFSGSPNYSLSQRSMDGLSFTLFSLCALLECLRYKYSDQGKRGALLRMILFSLLAIPMLIGLFR